MWEQNHFCFSIGKAGRMKGITVLLYERKKTGMDAFGHDIYEEIPVEVKNVLVAPVSISEAIETLNLTGKKIVYNLGIPKGDLHRWEGCRIDFLGESWRAFGPPQEGIEKLVPTPWHKKVTVERYE